MNLTRENIIKILRKHQTETYPEGVGSIFRCITSDSYGAIADEIIKTDMTWYDKK